MKKIEKATEIIGFSPGALWIAVGVLIASGIIIKLIMDLVIDYRALRRPKMTDERSIREKLQSDHERLSRLEKTTRKQDEELELILRSQIAMIHHMIDGNGVDKLKKTQSDIEHYLITGKMQNMEA